MIAAKESFEREIYKVTPRFGLAALLGLMTAFAILFASLRQLNAPQMLYLFFGSLGFATSLAQMRWGAMPRMASIGAGALLLPLWIFGSSLWFAPRRWGSFVVEFIIFGVPVGGFLGYLTGALVAGVFLLAEKLEESTRTKVSS